MRTMLRFVLILATATVSLSAQDWSSFRGPNGSGLSTAAKIPTEFGPDKNLVWRLPLPPGHSSPILFGNRIYLTAFRADQLVTIAIDRQAGKILWERAAPDVKTKLIDKRNNAASPSPAVEADGVYVFFPDYGLIAYNAAGAEKWKMPLGPFNNIYGMGASPVIVGNLLILACDQSLGSYVMALDKRTGKQVWKVDRPEAKSGHSTPIVWRGPDGRDQILLPGSFLLTSYDAATGKKLWWVGGLSFEMKSTPVIGGDTIYVNGYGAPVNDPGNKVNVPPADEVWKTSDANGDGAIQKTEFPRFTPAFWFDVADLDVNGALSKDEWAYYRAAIDSQNGVLAIRLGGSGDMSDKAIRWKYQRSVPQLPSPLLYKNVLYMVNDNGIVTLLNPETGEMLKQGRLTGAAGPVFASPVAADGHIYFTTEHGAVAVVEPGTELNVLKVNVLNEDAYATPAIAEGRLYVRTTQALYAFGATASASAPAAAAQWPPTPRVNGPEDQTGTFSILGFDPETGEIGGAVHSKVFAVGNGVLWAEAGVGAVATQAIVDVSYGPQGMVLLKQGMAPGEIIKKILADDKDPGYGRSRWPKAGRQFAVMNAKGEFAAHTGPEASTWAGDKQGKHCTAQGNILAGPAVVEKMVEAFEKTAVDEAGRKNHISYRLQAALEAGDAAGGDTRGKQSAAMIVVKKDGGVWLHNDVVLRLQVDDNPEPIKELRRLVDLAARQRPRR